MRELSNLNSMEVGVSQNRVPAFRNFERIRELTSPSRGFLMNQ